MQSWKGKSKEEGTNLSKLRNGGRGYGPKEKEPHLYLVLDDWSWGYTIRKIDLSLGYPVERLPPASMLPALPGYPAERMPPASFKFEAPRSQPKYIAGAFDSKILAMQPMNSKFKSNNMDGILIYDVHMPSFIVGPPQMMDPVDPIYIPVGGRLFALASGSFQLLYPPPFYESDWKDFVWMWHTLPEPPFLHHLVACYAVHSDQRTIFVSVGGQAPATYSFDTSETLMNGDCRWKHHGKLMMPFDGCAYFAPELNVWVGLQIAAIDEVSNILQITAIDEVSLDGSPQGLGLKVCKDDLCYPSIGEKPIGATLIPMGGGNKFCLLEYYEHVLTESSTSEDNEEQQDRNICMRLTTFSLKYDKNGDLMIGNRCIQKYSVPSGVSWSMLKTPVAFWM